MHLGCVQTNQPTDDFHQLSPKIRKWYTLNVEGLEAYSTVFLSLGCNAFPQWIFLLHTGSALCVKKNMPADKLSIYLFV